MTFPGLPRKIERPCIPVQRMSGLSPWETSSGLSRGEKRKAPVYCSVLDKR